MRHDDIVQFSQVLDLQSIAAASNVMSLEPRSHLPCLGLLNNKQLFVSQKQLQCAHALHTNCWRFHHVNVATVTKHVSKVAQLASRAFAVQTVWTALYMALPKRPLTYSLNQCMHALIMTQGMPVVAGLDTLGSRY